MSRDIAPVMQWEDRRIVTAGSGLAVLVADGARVSPATTGTPVGILVDHGGTRVRVADSGTPVANAVVVAGRVVITT